MLTVEYLQKANELFKSLEEGLELQQEIIDGLKKSLEEYGEFMAQLIEEMRND